MKVEKYDWIVVSNQYPSSLSLYFTRWIDEGWEVDSITLSERPKSELYPMDAYAVLKRRSQ